MCIVKQGGCSVLVNYMSLTVGASFTKLVNARFKRLLLLQVAVLQINKKYLNRFEFYVKALFVSRRVEEINKPPTKTRKK